MRMRSALVALVALSFVAPALAQVVVPNDRASTAGGGSFLGPLTTGPRTYQLLIDDSQLTGLLGQQLSGITWRSLPSATTNWPTADVTYSNFDIRLSDSVEPAARSLTFADNIVGTQTLVRTGSLLVPAGSFRGEAGSSPQDFGMIVNFDTPYPYSGGNLLIELRHSGHGGTSRSTDAVLTSGAGYGTLFSAAWQSSATATTGLQGNAVVTQIHVVPEPGMMSIAIGALALIVRRRSR